MPNRLANSTSPYLLQHKDNPVDWYEWGDDAFAAAKLLDRPILLSVGYAACHWCHVMAHESFEDPETASDMNDSFVNVKVDREERPDVDRIYMDAVQAFTGSGGWPMTVFLTPDGRPFYAGTYFPDEPRGNYPTFRNVLAAIADAWTQKRQDVEHQAERLTEAVRTSLPPADEAPGDQVVAAGLARIAEGFDSRYGGFGAAPKFPQAPTLELLLRSAETPKGPDAMGMLTKTLAAMASGGIYDQLGGGFARYSVDRGWLVPHFEKMLYDNALLARSYLRGWQVTGEAGFRRIAVETLDYMLSDLLLPDGGFASAEDADSEGVEGKFYVWPYDELVQVAGEHADEVASFYGATPNGNFEGANILHRPDGLDTKTPTVLEASQALLEHRAKRVRPGLDDKAVTAWNGLALRALAEGGAVLREPQYLEAARATADFVLNHLFLGDRLMRSWRAGASSVPGFCEDYAAMTLGLYWLFQATGEANWYDAGHRLLWQMVDLFADPDGGFFNTGSDAETLITRPKELMDNPVPSANSLAAEALLLEAALGGERRPLELMDGVFRSAGRFMEQLPSAVGHLLAVRHTAGLEGRQVVVIGPGSDRATDALTDVVWDSYHSDLVLARHSGEGPAYLPLFEGRVPHDGPPTAYACRHFVCDQPTTDPDELRLQLDRAS